MCAWGVTAALYAREKTGKGQVVDTSLMGSLTAMLAFIMAAPAMLGQEFPREIRAAAGNPLYNHYRCQDDRWIAIAHLDPNRYWPNLTRALGIEELQNDPRFNSIETRSKNARELVGVLDERFATKTREAWTHILQQEGCIFTPIQTPLEVSNDPQALANDYFVNVQHPAWGKIKMAGFPWNFSDTPASWRCEAPGFGQHTKEILLELGYTEDVIANLQNEGIIQQGSSSMGSRGQP
jgi:crotonobetainyl-CoA:carnitine CoA-transferase CaiB-like acyl-CoA transferase